jgi:hypothetical protein
MAEYRISVDLSGVMQAAGVVDKAVMPLLHQAVRAVAQQTSINWQEAVQRAKLWSGEKDAYTASIQWQMTGDFSAVVSSDYRYANEIETGRPAKDLKVMLNTSMKVRQTKDGRRFLVIPFRQSTPGNDAHSPSMPASVYDLAKDMTASKVDGQSQRPAGEVTALHPTYGMRPLKNQTPFASNPKTKSQFLVPKNHYNWGQKLDTSEIDGLSDAEKKRYAGMYRFDTRTPGGKRYSTYLTFRIMIEGSQGWVVPPKPGLFLAKRVADEMQPMAVQAFGEAVKRTLK